MDNVEKRGIGDILDEVITISQKISNGVKVDKSVDRLVHLCNYLEATAPEGKLSTDLYMFIALLSASAGCWASQDRIARANSDEEVAEAARDAQDLNKLRNISIGWFNEKFSDGGIITEKSY